MTELLVEFDQAAQPIGPLREAAYRIIALASCTIENTPSTYRCRLMPKLRDGKPAIEGEELRHHFIDLVTDENLREKVSAETAQIRDLILALAFGALAEERSP